MSTLTSSDSLMLRKAVHLMVVSILLAGPPLGMMHIWRDARRVPVGVLGGALFKTPWHKAHAGFSMDQPTIGKWYFWSSFFGGTWCLAALSAARLARRWNNRRYHALVGAAILAGLSLYLLVHTVPFYWTMQYIHAMGFTYRRGIALAWGIAGYFVLLGMTVYLLRQLSFKEMKLLRRERSPASGSR